MWLAVVKAYEPRWTQEIHSEWIRNVLADRPDVSADQLQRTRRLMDQIDPKSLVSGYEARIAELSLPDEGDRHVLAAAIEAGASAIVTYNLPHFPRSALVTHGIHALATDAFLQSLLRQDPARFLRGVRKHRQSLRNPPKTVEEYLAALRALGLSGTARRLEPYRGEL